MYIVESQKEVADASTHTQWHNTTCTEDTPIQSVFIANQRQRIAAQRVVDQECVFRKKQTALAMEEEMEAWKRSETLVPHTAAMMCWENSLDNTFHLVRMKIDF